MTKVNPKARGTVGHFKHGNVKLAQNDSRDQIPIQSGHKKHLPSGTPVLPQQVPPPPEGAHGDWHHHVKMHGGAFSGTAKAVMKSTCSAHGC
jgi:hypothetical protein